MKIILEKSIEEEFMRAFEIVTLRSPTISTIHKNEKDKIIATYNRALNNEIEFELDMTDSFYETWVWRTFEELFNPRSEISKAIAKKLKRLYESLNIQKYNEDFLKNYNNFTD